jgi:predicted dehydrogenase
MQSAPTAELVALCDIDEAQVIRAAADIGISKTYTSWEAMLDTDIDAVVVASPMPLHVPHSVAAIAAGKHVLSEVTAATSIEQCWELLEAVRASDRKYMLASNYCYMRPWNIVVGLVKAGKFGELYYGEADQIQDFKAGFPHPDTGYNWRTSELALRRGHHYITHNLGPLYQVFGERVTSVVCLGSGQHHLEWAKADDTCVVLCQTESGKLIRIRLDFFSSRPNNFTYYGLTGVNASYEAPRGPKDEHKIYIDGQTPRGTWQSLWDFEAYLSDDWKMMPKEAIDNSYNGGTPLMIEDFARCIAENTRPPIDVVDALNITAPGLISEVSRERGGVPVDVPNFGK